MQQETIFQLINEGIRRHNLNQLFVNLKLLLETENSPQVITLLSKTIKEYPEESQTIFQQNNYFDSLKFLFLLLKNTKNDFYIKNKNWKNKSFFTGK